MYYYFFSRGATKTGREDEAVESGRERLGDSVITVCLLNMPGLVSEAWQRI